MRSLEEEMHQWRREIEQRRTHSVSDAKSPVVVVETTTVLERSFQPQPERVDVLPRHATVSGGCCCWADPEQDYRMLCDNDVTQTECLEDLNGEWHFGEHCLDENDLLCPRACCQFSECEMMTWDECQDIGGYSRGFSCDNENICKCRKRTDHVQGYNENHYYYGCGDDCTPDTGDSASNYDYLSVYNYAVDGTLCSVDCSGSSSSYCDTWFGCFCPPFDPADQCHWTQDCSGSWDLDPIGEASCYNNQSCTTTCDCGFCGCTGRCPYGTLVCVPNEACDDGQDCYVYTDLGDGDYCWRSSGFCNVTTEEYVDCPCEPS